MISDFLSDVELYFSENINESEKLISIFGDEQKHISKVMRHSINDEIFVTNGKGKIFDSTIIELKKDEIVCEISGIRIYQNEFLNIYFCIPKLKAADRFEFALEKITELGLTNIIVYDSDRGITKGNKPERWNKILQSAMKQSLRSFLPELQFAKSLKEIFNLDGNKILFDQNSEKKISEIKFQKDQKYYFIFGPEGGFSNREISLSDQNEKYKLTANRLRSETAIISAASIIQFL